MRHLRICIRPVAALVILMVISMFGWNSLFSKDSKDKILGLRGAELVKIDDHFYVPKMQLKEYNAHKKQVLSAISLYHEISTLDFKSLNLDNVRNFVTEEYLHKVNLYYLPDRIKDRKKESYLDDWILGLHSCNEIKLEKDYRLCNFKESREFVVSPNLIEGGRTLAYFDFTEAARFNRYYLILVHNESVLSPYIFTFYFDKKTQRMLITPPVDDAIHYFYKSEGEY